MNSGAHKEQISSYEMSSGKMEGAILIASLTGKNTSITIRLP
jgi:hypothetical protein